MFNDPYQLIRMTAFWPFVLGGTAALIARSIFWLTGKQAVSRFQAKTCVLVFVLAWASTSIMASLWDGSESYWLAFTVGLGVIALTLAVTAASFFVKDWKNE